MRQGDHERPPADGGDRRRGKHHASRSSKTFARRTIGPIENNHNLAGLEPPPNKKIPFGLADRDDDTAGTHKDSMTIKGVVNRSHERHASQLGGKIAENRARHHMRVNDIRLKAPAQTDQSGEIASERKRVVVLALAYLRAPYAMRVQKRIVMTSGAGIDNSMPLPRLSAGEIDGDVDVPIRRLAMLDQMENAHCFSGMLARGFVECHGWHLLISFTKIANVNNGDPSRKRQSSVQSSAFNVFLGSGPING